MTRKVTMAMKIIEELCTACGDCEPECPTESIQPKRGLYFIEESTCTACEGDFDSPRCVEICPIDQCVLTLAA